MKDDYRVCGKRVSYTHLWCTVPSFAYKSMYPSINAGTRPFINCSSLEVAKKSRLFQFFSWDQIIRQCRRFLSKLHRKNQQDSSSGGLEFDTPGL